jgi:hypothetical protein
MNHHHVFSLPSILCAATLCLAVHGAQAQTTTQTLALNAGWNAVHLRVTPQASSVATLFAGTPVEVVSSWYPEKQKVASLQDPTAEPWKSAEWRTWQADGRAGAFLNNLHALESGRSYLIKAAAATTISVSGTVTLDRLTWHAQSFNLVGLPADPAAPATLGAFFAASPAHLPLRAFKLTTGRWQAVPATAAIDPSAAYWIWCGEGSEFQGPLDVRVSGNLGLSRAETNSSTTVSLLSTSASPLTVTVTASGNFALTGITRERLAGISPALVSAVPLSFSASAGEPSQYRFAPAVGSPPVNGATSVLEFRAAGVRLSVPVVSIP